MTFILHTSGPVTIGTTTLGGITSISSALGSQVKGEATSGEVMARVTSLLGQKPSMGFTTEDIKAALGACGPMGVSLATKNLVLYGSKLLSGGRLDTSGHVSLTAPLGVLVPQQLSCSHQGNATISYQAHPLSVDDATDPWTLSTGAGLPTPAPSLWTLFTATIGGVVIDQQTQVKIDFGLKVVTEGSSSNVRDQIATIRSIAPKISLTSSKQGKFLAYLGVQGAFSIVLRKRKQGGTFDTGSVTLSGNAYAFQETPFSASGQGTATIQLQADVTWDGTLDPITYVGA